MTEVTMLDSIYDPFGEATDQQSFLNFEKLIKDPLPPDRDGEKTRCIFQLSETLRIQQRIRYGVWQALGDIGGFYDGLGLIFGTIINQFAATKFVIELFKGVHVNQQTETAEEKKKRKDLA